MNLDKVLVDDIGEQARRMSEEDLDHLQAEIVATNQQRTRGDSTFDDLMECNADLQIGKKMRPCSHFGRGALRVWLKHEEEK